MPGLQREPDRAVDLVEEVVAAFISVLDELFGCLASDGDVQEFVGGQVGEDVGTARVVEAQQGVGSALIAKYGECGRPIGGSCYRCRC